jgi:hypothetical protein
MRNLIPYSRRIVGLSLALSLILGMFAGSTAALAENPEDSVRGFYDTLLTTMKNGPTLGQSGRYARLAPVVDRVFDVPSMTRLAIGPTWAALSSVRQQQLVEAFPLCRGDLRRSVRQLFRAAAAGHWGAALQCGRHCPNQDCQIRR